MNSTFDELLDLLDIPHTKGSRWYEDKKLKFEQLLERQQLLQQTPCTTLRELLSAKVDEIDKVRERKEKQGLQTGVETGIVLGLKFAFQLIEDSQPVA